MEKACAEAVRSSETSAVQAVAALADVSWPSPVIGAAAAIAAESASNACVRKLVAEVRSNLLVTALAS